MGRAQQLIRIDLEDQPGHEVLARMVSEYKTALPYHDVVLVRDYGKEGLTHIRSMLELARAAAKPSLVDPKGNDYSRYAGATVVTPNLSELAQVVGNWASDADPHQRAKALRRELGPAGLLVAQSGQGMTLLDADGHFTQPAQARQVFDITGAGDTVIATLATMLATGLSLRQALLIANRAGGVVVGRLGPAAVST